MKLVIWWKKIINKKYFAEATYHFVGANYHFFDANWEKFISCCFFLLKQKNLNCKVVHFSSSYIYFRQKHWAERCLREWYWVMSLIFFGVYESSYASVLAVLKNLYKTAENLKKCKNVFKLDSLVNDVIDWYPWLKGASDFSFRTDGEVLSFKAYL